MIMDRKRFLDQAKKGVKEIFSKKDASIIHAVRAIDDLDAVKSLLFQRLDEWFKINFPEFPLPAEETYARVVAEFGDKSEFEFNKLSELVGESKATELMQKAEKSFGANFTLEDKNAIKKLALTIADVYDCRKNLEEYVRSKAKIELKNLCYLVDELLAARLLSLAGSKEKLAEMPASTLQVIGAEKALFKHLKKGTLPPKHGLIFQSPLVNSAPLDHRGKIARALAAKLAIAAKADAFTGNFIAPKLKESLDARLKKIKTMPVDPNRKLQKPPREFNRFDRRDNQRGGKPFWNKNKQFRKPGSFNKR